ncbi:endo-1,4-beta-xylanase [Paenibacillus sp. DCT19]|uniref:endo-1,4-beta-xylanase n=1 Tax=Paenibacillus sp. DCT19 TaxID=2211212 RepID=UPI0013E379EF|nr:endo-1,4-beta-xylanase [Paenibacillus sp. DCT19]
MRYRKWWSLCLTMVMVISVLPLTSLGKIGAEAASEGELLLSHSYEEGTSQGWIPRGNVTLAVTEEDAYEGTHALQTTSRTAAWNGPALSVTNILEKHAVYEITGYVKLLPGATPSNLKFTVERREGTQAAQYDQVNTAIPVTDQGWVKLQGQYSYQQGTDLLLYLESDDPTSSYMLDSFQLRRVTPAPEPENPGEPGEQLFVADFEDDQVGNWRPRGSEQLSIVTGIGYNSMRSLKTSSRTETFHGPLIEVLNHLEKGSTVHVSFWAMYDEGPATQVINGSLEKEYHNDSSTREYATFASTNLTKGQWKKIEADVVVPSESSGITGFRFYAETPWKPSGNVTESDTIPFYIDDVVITAVAPLEIEQDIPNLASTLGTSYDVGAAIDLSALNPQDPHAQLLVKHFNSITAGNFMKIDAMQPREGEFVWTDTDRLVEFAENNNMRVRGHTLVWHSQVPEWFFTSPDDVSQPATREQLLARMKTHIQTIMHRYQGKVHTWDVVNEVISDGGGLRNQASGSKWRDIIGDVDGDGDDNDYIELAFRYAREADPNAVLVINDYGLEGSINKLNDMVNLVEKLLAKGTPIDAVGFQMHVSMYGPNVQQIREAFERIVALGVNIQVTELDVSIYSGSSEQEKPVTDELMMQQAYRYKELFDLFQEFDQRGVLDSVTVWGLADDGTWLDNHPVQGRKDAPLLFDRKLKAKPAYWALVDKTTLPVYRNEWTASKASPATPDSKGKEDILWGAVKGVQVAHRVEGTSDVTGQASVLWDDKKVNLRIEIQDTSRHKGDQVQVFLEEELYEATEGAGNDFTVTSKKKKEPKPLNGQYTFERDGGKGKDHKIYKVKETSTGYIVYASIPLPASVLAEGKTLSMDFRIKDQQADGQTSIVVWNDVNDKQPNEPGNRGKLKLGSKLKHTKVTYGTPVLDGQKDRIWKKAASIQTDVWVLGNSGATATAQLLWDEQYLYVLAEVKDPLLSKASVNAYEQDSIEVFVDLNHNKTSFYQEDDAQYRINYDNETSFGGNALQDQFQSSTRLTNAGYIIEAAIPLDLVPTNAIPWIGFDLQVNDDSTGEGRRNSVSIWSDASGNSYRDTSGFGNLLLVGK